jgi:hypothetical protein
MLNKKYFIFFMKSFQNNQINIEKLALNTALSLITNLMTLLSWFRCPSFTITKSNIELWELKYGVQNTNPTIILAKDSMELLVLHFPQIISIISVFCGY